MSETREAVRRLAIAISNFEKSMLPILQRLADNHQNYGLSMPLMTEKHIPKNRFVRNGDFRALRLTQLLKSVKLLVILR